MGKKILYIVLGALLVFGILFLLWSWFFKGSSNPSATTGTLGNAGNVSQTTGQSSNPGNGEISLNNSSGINAGAGSYNAQGVYVGPGNGTYDANGNYVGTQTSSVSTGGITVGAGSYNAQGVFVGAGNGTYDAQGNFVGTEIASSSGGTLGNGSTAGGTLGAGGSTSGGSTSGGTSGGGTTGGTLGTGNTATGITTASGVSWLGSPFNPADINSVSSGVNGFVPTITTPVGGSGSSGTTLIEALAATAIAGSLTCAIQAGYIPLQTTQATAATAAVIAGTKVAATGLALTQVGLPASLQLAPTLYLGTGYAFDLITHVQLAGVGQIQSAQYAVQAAQLTQQTANSSESKFDKFTNCLINVIAKVALQQLTISVVNWINSGFQGQPSFVSNFQQFFSNTADLAAGAFISAPGSPLAFLCSPFQLQIKIAIAQSYANRNAMSCSLTKVISDVNGFMNGNFSSGGWGGMISFTTMPTNNPYGAYAYAQAGLATAQANALANAKNNISPTGFLNLQKQTCPVTSATPGTSYNTTAGIGQYSTTINSSAGVITTNQQQYNNCLANNAGDTTFCTQSINNQTVNAAGTTISGGSLLASNSQAGQTYCQPGCQCSVTTPGGVIADSLGAVNKSGVDQLGLTQDIDQIITALTTQLMTKILQNGLTSLSQTTTQTPADIAAQSQALSLLTDMQNNTTLAEQLGAIYQGSISDIESEQAQLNNLANCWSSVASSTSGTANAAAANAQLQSLSTEVTNYNNDITQVNNGIASLNQFEAQVSSAASDADVTNATNSYQAAVASGAFPSQNDVTTAQQNRTTLQSQLATIDQSTQAGLAQCQAAGGQ